MIYVAQACLGDHFFSIRTRAMAIQLYMVLIGDGQKPLLKSEWFLLEQKPQKNHRPFVQKPLFGEKNVAFARVPFSAISLRECTATGRRICDCVAA